jgi:predicted regulator of Ras-like GTPase activity (Roadblock/LC7/MglB family)
MASLKHQLNDFLKIDGINGVVLVGRDGFVIEGIANDGRDVETVGAVISTGLGTSEMVGKELNVGALTQSMVEYDNGILLLGTVGKDALLCVVCDANANLGNARLQLKKRTPELAAEL